MLSDVLITQVADATKTLEKKHTEMKSKVLIMKTLTLLLLDFVSIPAIAILPEVAL